jgi:hypothetical protein
MVGTEARSEAIIKALEAEPWHCLSFKNHPCCVFFRKLFILELLHSQPNGMWGQENGKS